MTEGEHTFTKTRHTPPSANRSWTPGLKISVSTVVRAFKRAGIVTELSDNHSDTEDNDDFDETEPGTLDAALAQLFSLDTEEEDFDGFVDG